MSFITFMFKASLLAKSVVIKIITSFREFQIRKLCNQPLFEENISFNMKFVMLFTTIASNYVHA